VGVQEPRGPAYTRRTKRGPGEIPCVRFDLALTGGGGEPVDLLRTLNSHGLIMLAPNARRDGDTVLRMPLRLADGRSTLAEIGPGPLGFARVTISGRLRGAAVQAELTALVRRILGLDEDLAPFYARAALDPALAWVTRGAGRFIRSASAFEDVVKTICTTNCAWSATIRMTDALVQGLGEPVTALPDKRLFPTPAAMAKASEAWYRDIARTGYRGPYLRAIAKDVAAGKLDLEGWAASTPATLGDAELEERLLALRDERLARRQRRGDRGPHRGIRLRFVGLTQDRGGPGGAQRAERVGQVDARRHVTRDGRRFDQRGPLRDGGRLGGFVEVDRFAKWSEDRDRHQRRSRNREGHRNAGVHRDVSSFCASSTATATERAASSSGARCALRNAANSAGGCAQAASKATVSSPT
jgi:hypothetical protein